MNPGVLSLPAFWWGSHQDIGSRTRQEDAVRAEPAAGLFIVSDGMGGHHAGDVASRMTVASVAEAVLRGVDCVRNPSQRRALLQMAIETANDRIRAEVPNLRHEPDKEEGMGATCTAILFGPEGEGAVVAQVGDSRCYRVRRGQLRKLTADHNAQIHGVRIAHGVTRAVGYRREVKVDLFLVEAGARDLFLLCTDGVHGSVPDTDIAGALAANAPARAARSLVKLALEAGASDNCTALVVSPLGGRQ